MYCGAAVSEADLQPETKERLQMDATDRYRSPNASSVRAFGAVLMIIGILADIVSMVLVFTADSSLFSVVTIGGTIVFILGLVLFRNG